MRSSRIPDLAIAATLSMALAPMASAALPPSHPMSFCRPFAPKQPSRNGPDPTTPCHACLLCSNRSRPDESDGNDDDVG